MRNKTRLEQFLERIKELIKNLLERLMLEERKLYLEEHPTKGKGYSTPGTSSPCSGPWKISGYPG